MPTPEMVRGVPVISKNHLDLARRVIATQALSKAQVELFLKCFEQTEIPASKLPELLVLCDRGSFCGSFARVFRTDLDQALELGNEKLVSKLLVGGKVFFVEGFDNEDMTKEELIKINQKWDDEVAQFRSLLDSETTIEQLPQRGNRRISLEEDDGKSYKYEISDLAEILCEDEPENPHTGELFSEERVNELRAYLELEIKLTSASKEYLD